MWIATILLNQLLYGAEGCVAVNLPCDIYFCDFKPYEKAHVVFATPGGCESR